MVVDLAYPPSNYERQTKGTKTNYNAQNKQMFCVEHNEASEKVILKSGADIRKIQDRMLAEVIRFPGLHLTFFSCVFFFEKPSKGL